MRESVRGLWSRHTEQKTGEFQHPGREVTRTIRQNTHMSTVQNARLSHPCPGHAGVLLGQRKEEGPQGLSHPDGPWRWEQRGVASPWGPEKVG